MERRIIFLPFCFLDNVEKPLRPSSWKGSKWSSVKMEESGIILTGDPIHPKTYSRTRHRSMDYTLLLQKDIVVYKKGFKIIIVYPTGRHELEFVRKISDEERVRIFNPKNERERRLRTNIWRAYRDLPQGTLSLYNGKSGSQLIKEYDQHKQSVIAS